MMIQIVNNDDKMKYFLFCHFVIDTEIELMHHNGTIRDLIFMHDSMKDDSILLSGGAGDCKVYVTDIKKQTPIKSYAGHQGKKKTNNLRVLSIELN
jgi:hypothetical protein